MLWWWRKKRLKLLFFWRRYLPTAQKGQLFWHWGTKYLAPLLFVVPFFSSSNREWSGSAASITSHLGKTDVVLVSVSESSNPEHNRLFCCCGAEDVVEIFVFMVVMKIFNSLVPHPPRSPNKGREGPSAWHPPMVGTRL